MQINLLKSFNKPKPIWFKRTFKFSKCLSKKQQISLILVFVCVIGNFISYASTNYAVNYYNDDKVNGLLYILTHADGYNKAVLWHTLLLHS